MRYLPIVEDEARAVLAVLQVDADRRPLAFLRRLLGELAHALDDLLDVTVPLGNALPELILDLLTMHAQLRMTDDVYYARVALLPARILVIRLFCIVVVVRVADVTRFP